MPNELKNCPFCGGKPNLQQWHTGDWNVCCENKRCCGSTIEYSSKETAIEVWNNRQPERRVEVEISEREFAFEEWCRFAVRRMTGWSEEDDKESLDFRRGIEKACSDMCVYFRTRKDYETSPYLERQAIEVAMKKCGMKWNSNRQRLDFYEHFESAIKEIIKDLIKRCKQSYEKAVRDGIFKTKSM